ncbi:hypothetical protein OHB49_43145 (plasmid) [Streptomyces sp. NBC_01717]|uniref:hypothetical protein n=1 Tax=Streptomyces sp. NBC_01717 TaxID=2975918 RepID=UPI002E3515A1|nr:hypothetical protein [Streptomyces sp. NBC_01717]
MSRWTAVFSREDGRSGALGGIRRSARRSRQEGGTGQQEWAGLPFVEDVGGVLLLRSSNDDAPDLATLTEVAHAVVDEEDVVTLVIGAPPGAGTYSSAFWERLGEALDSLRHKGTSCVRLVMAGAGDERRGRPCAARRIADAWKMDVLAPDGAVLIAPGGTLFAQQDGTSSGKGWWRFTPGQAPSMAGCRAPAPLWQDAFARIPASTDDGCVVEHIPAGILMRPAESPAPVTGDLCFAVPMDSELPMVLIGAAGAENVAAEEVAALLAALPAAQRTRTRLAPGGSRDLLPLGHSVADMLGSDVNVLTGLPLLPGDARPGNETTEARPTLMGFDGHPRWRPFVAAVACRPAGSAATGEAGEARKGTTVLERPDPRLLQWFPPLPGEGIVDQGIVYLDERWQVAVTRAGLAIGERGTPRPPLAASPPDPDAFAIELGSHGQELDPSLWPALSRLLEELGSEVCAKASFLVSGTLAHGERDLRDVAAKHRVTGIRYVVPRQGTAQPSRTAAQPTESADHSRPRASERSAEAPHALTSGLGSAALTNPSPHPAAAHDESGAPEPPKSPDPSLTSSSAPDTAADTTAETHSIPALKPATETTATTNPTEPPAVTTEAVRSETARPATGTSLSPGAGLPEPASETETAGPDSDSAASVVATALGEQFAMNELPQGGDTEGAAVTDHVTTRGQHETPQPHGSHTPDADPLPPPAPHAPARSPKAPADVPVSIRPGHVSSQTERSQFRELATGVWEHHSAAVSRALTRMPALRGEELEAARADLIAVQAYLTNNEEFVSGQALAEDLLAGGTRLLPYVACLASGLRRLPSYRGISLRGLRSVGGIPGNTGEALEPGSLLQAPGPVSSLAHAAEWPGGAPLGYAIWSVTGRRVRQLLPGGSSPGSDEVVFAPGTAFRVLGTHEVTGSAVVLLRELPATESATASNSPGGQQLDRTALTRLEEALTGSLPMRGSWPERCVGRVTSGG